MKNNISDSTQKETLQARLEKTIGTENLEKIELPLHITSNLNKNLRIYQQNALRYYLANFQNTKFKQKHLMFNLATGSGKTLLMAALMLDCFQKGYVNFLFFVSSTSILEKTKDNFINIKSAKYLFKNPMVINGKNVNINIVQNFDEAQQNAINIVFSTTQGLYSLFTNEKENAITFEDLENHKIVFLADEAHHLNSETKKNLTKEDESQKIGWEYIIHKAFTANPQNLMFEFTATIPNYESVMNKYADKIIFEYNLKKFYDEKFSKKIFLLKYENKNIKNRFLGAICLNIYRQLLALKYLPENRSFKPVMLFKSERKVDSKNIQKEFFEYIHNLKKEDIHNFYLFVDEENQNLLENEELLSQSKIFFKEYWGENFEINLLEIIQSEFTENVCLNVNEEKEAENYQFKLNSLENTENPIRVIFAVDKLNEGWDVLNLFDIIRTKTNGKTSANMTTKEAQLIGRGARYYPFLYKESDIYKRKFDDEQTPLTALESLGYHTINEVDFIQNLNKELEDMGLKPTENKKIILNLNKKAKKMFENGIKEIPLALNERMEAKPLLDSIEEKQKNVIKIIQDLQIPLLKNNYVEEIEAFQSKEEAKHYFKSFSLKDIPINVWQKALNKTNNLNFKNLKEKHHFSSRLAFIEKVQEQHCIIHKNQDLKNKEIQLNIALYIFEEFQNKLNGINEKLAKGEKNYQVLDFKIDYCFKLESPREIWTKKKAENFDLYDWLVYDKCLLDSNLEKEFLEFIENHKTMIDSTFQNWVIIRNEQYENLALYDNNKKSPHYAERFFPDFIFWGETKNGEKVAAECFMEPKGDYLTFKDTWKENLLISLQGECIQKNEDKIYVEGLCFFSKEKENQFKKSFFQFIEKYKIK